MKGRKTLAMAMMPWALSIGVAITGWDQAAIAYADDNYGPHQWCPGQSMQYPTGPWDEVAWDMHVCHTWYVVDYQQGNLPSRYTGEPSRIWDGPDPPPPPPVRVCPPIAFLCP